MNEMQTELKVYCEDVHTGQYSSAFYLPIVPTMSAAEICESVHVMCLSSTYSTFPSYMYMCCIKSLYCYFGYSYHKR